VTCPRCGSDTNVTETRAVGTSRTRRRRICSAADCPERFTTVEFIWRGKRGPTPEMLPVSSKKLKTALSELLAALSGDEFAGVEES
jgi:hypothetical protein